jgi:hypothetical protein
MLWVAAITDSNWRTEDSTKHLVNTPKGGTTKLHRRRPDPKLNQGFPLAV